MNPDVVPRPWQQPGGWWTSTYLSGNRDTGHLKPEITHTVSVLKDRGQLVYCHAKARG